MSHVSNALKGPCRCVDFRGLHPYYALCKDDGRMCQTRVICYYKYMFIEDFDFNMKSFCMQSVLVHGAPELTNKRPGKE